MKSMHTDALKPELLFQTIQAVALEKQVPTYVVGGFVRDYLLRRPCKDIDFVCVGDGLMIAEAVAKKLGASEVITFKNFGTAHFNYQDYEIEFIGARKESYRTDSRKPDVEAGTLEDDQLRRDFTINAMAINVYDAYGELLDPFHGKEDLRNMVIKTPTNPDVTFSDDPLRMMRAIRFSSQLNFDIDADTFDSISRQKERIHIVSMERVIDELNKIVQSPVPSYGFKLLFFSGLLHEFFPELTALHGVEYVDNKAHKDNFFHTLQVLDNVAKMSDNLWLRWAAILHDIAKPATKRFEPGHGWTFHGHEERGARMVPAIFRRLKLPMNEHMQYVKKLVRLHLRPIALVHDVTDSAIRRLLFEAGEHTPDLMMLCRADITSKNTNKVEKFLRNFELVEEKMVKVEEQDHVRNFQPPITGIEIMEWLQLPPSKLVGDIKDEIKEAILEGTLKNDRAEAIDYLKKIALAKGLSVQGIEAMHDAK